MRVRMCPTNIAPVPLPLCAILRCESEEDGEGGLLLLQEGIIETMRVMPPPLTIHHTNQEGPSA